ncbi:ribosomal protein S6 [Collybia nuda]|uniref:Ribosomal protein S6 n=1 Tax=Collybia nuda TaxID=64659 RepID=A0A9P5YC87_9AGAR|nr:ribosomal protein S6 [Collybia nuda]
MPFYQMLCITTHYKEYKHIKELVRQTATHVMNAGGVVRNINSWGTLTLPQRMRRHGEIHSTGDYWTMHFDTAPRTLRSLNSIMRRDPRVIRWTVLKLGAKVEDIAKEGQKAQKGVSVEASDLVN